jgi:membrane protein
VTDDGPTSGDQPVPDDAPAPVPLDEQDLQILKAVGLDPSDVSDLVKKVFGRLSPRTKRWILWSVDNWPGRVVFRLANGLRHLQVFDRAMTVGAQMFTSVFPIIIMGASLFGGSQVSQSIYGAGLPPDVESVLNEAVSPSSGSGAFGLVGILVVLISATSLSRALTRAYDTIWRHGATRLPPQGAWRWLAAVMVLAVALVLSHKLVSLVRRVPPPGVWELVALVVISTAIACYLPWMLMAGRVSARLLLPGALLFGAILGATRPIAERYLTTSIAVSADRFGAIGIAFTSLTYLYCISWVLLATAVLGRVIVIDPGALGRLIRGTRSLEEISGRGEDEGRLFS